MLRVVSTPDWDQGDNLEDKMQEASLDLEGILNSTSWEDAKQVLDQNAAGILEAGHWGVLLMVFEEELFYGQDRFDHLVWRIKRRAVF